MTFKSVIIFQHVSVEHPGVFRNFFKDDGIQLHTVELDRGESIPDLKNFDALWVMGGPMDVWEQDKYSWLAEEITAIRKAIDELKMPLWGFVSDISYLLMLMAQKLALVTSLKSELCLLEKLNMESSQNFFVICRICAIQSLSYGDKVFSVQYHQEITEKTVSDWSKISEYKISLEKGLGENAIEKLQKDVLVNINNFNHAAELLYRNWKSTVFNN